MLSATVLPRDSDSEFVPVATNTQPPALELCTTKDSVEQALTDLLRVEEDYIITLNLIDERITPLWSKQSGAADFADLLTLVRDISLANKRFQSALGQIAARQHSVREISDELMQWAKNLEIPYTNYCKAFIRDIDQREDIAGNLSVQQVLEDLSTAKLCKVTLESLFNAPIEQLQFYKTIYTRVMKNTEPGQNNHLLLGAALEKIDLIIPMTSGSDSLPEKELPAIDKLHIKSTVQDDIGLDLSSFRQQIDCSQVKDIFTKKPMDYNLPRMASRERITIRDDFVLMPKGNTGISTRVHLVLAPEMLMVCREKPDTDASAQRYYLMYPPLSVSEITVQALMIERELLGDYVIEFNIMKKKSLKMRAGSKEQRNAWLGLGTSSPSKATLTPRALSLVATQKVIPAPPPPPPLETANIPIRPKKKSVIRRDDVFTFYEDNTGEISPIGSSSEDESDFDKASSFASRNTNEEKRTLPSETSETTRPSTSDPEPEDDPYTSRKTLSSGLTALVLNKSLPPIPPPSPQKEKPVTPLPIPKSTAVGKPISIKEPSLPSKPMPVTTLASAPEPTPTADLMPAMKPLPPPSETASSLGATPSINISFPDHTDLDMRLSFQPPNFVCDTLATPPAQTPDSTVVTNPDSLSPVTNGTQILPHVASVKQQHNSQHFAPVPQDPRYAQPQQHPLTPQQSPIYNQRPPPPLHQVPPHRPHSEVSRTGYQHPAQGSIPQRRSLSPMANPAVKQDPATATQPHPGFFRSSQLATFSYDELGSPPRSPNLQENQANSIREVVYSNGHCEVFHWKDESWYAVDGQCLIEVRKTNNNRSSIAIRLQATGQLYLNAWILPRIQVHMAAEVDVSITVVMNRQEETYLVHCVQPADASALMHCLLQMQKEAVIGMQSARHSTSMVTERAPVMTQSSSSNTQSQESIAQSRKPVMQCKCKLFVQNEHSNWSSFGNVTMKIAVQLTNKKMYIDVENEKSGKTTKLVSASVLSNNVERINPKRISFLLINEQERSSIVYMVQLREEETGNKIFEYLKTRNAENGW